MQKGELRERLFDWEPHPTIKSSADLERFHEEVSLWRKLYRHGVNPVVFTVIFTVLVVGPGVVLTTVYGLDHPLVSIPMLGVLFCNTLLTFVGVFFIDTRFPVVLTQIRKAFDMSDEEYYGFVGRLFERLYHLSFYSPLVPGPHGRDHRMSYWVGLCVMYIGWAILLASLVPVEPPPDIVGKVLLFGYYLFIVGYASISLFTAILFITYVWLYLTVKASRFLINLRFTAGDTHYGLKPFGQFLFRTLFIGLAMVGFSGVIGLFTGNPLLLIFASLLTPLVIGWFAGSQYGFHHAIVATKRARLRKLQNQYANSIDPVCIESTPEPEKEMITNADALITLKNEIESLPDWPIDTRILIEVVSITVLSNIPSIIGFLI